MKNFLAGDNCKLGYYVNGAQEDFETQEFEFGKEYELHLKIKGEFLGFDDGYLVFDSGIRGETYIAVNEIQKVYEV